MIAAATLLAAGALGPVVMRGESEPDPRRVIRIDIAGVTLEGPAGGPEILGWQRIKRVLGSDADSAAPFLPIADSAWRAEARLLRGDLPLAAPLFEDLFEQLRRTEGPTALLAAWGTARVRSARGDSESAIPPWLAGLESHARGFRLPAPTADAVLADESGLLTDLPPIFVRSPALDALLIGWPESEPGSPAAGIAALYHASAFYTASGKAAETAALTGSPSATPVEQRLRAIVISFSADDADVRAECRASLLEALNAPTGDWREAWIRAALGRSFLRETDPALRERGVLELLHLPARFAADQPALTAVALTDALAEIRSRGDTRAEAILESQLRAIDPRHPGLQRIIDDPSIGVTSP